MPVIDVGLIFEDIETAYKFLLKYAPNAQKVWRHADYAFRYCDNLLCFTFQKSGIEPFKGQRYHFVFTTQDVINSEWYRQVGAKLAAGGNKLLCRNDGTIIGDSKKEDEKNDR